MAVIKCKMCGGDLVIEPGATVAECEYCGSRQTVPNQDNEKKLTLFARANRLRASCEFDKAAGVYESIVAEFPQEAEAYWGLVLCKYGIEYVDDPATGKKIPTCHRSSFESVLDDGNFDQALENADVVARKVYREEAKQIEELRKGIIEVSAKEEPYDIFICYKETDDKGDRTLDSVLAQDIYDALTEKGYRVFFSRITLEDKLGQEYEPYIFAALNSAKILLAVGTDYEYYNAVWVKNEWSRYLMLMAKDRTKHLIPCYKNIDAYDMPKEFAKLQAQDMGKVGAMQDLLRGIEKILPKNAPATVIQEKVIVSGGGDSKVTALLDRGNMALEDGDWAKADSFFEDVLNNDSKNAQAYLGKTLAQERCRTMDALVRKRLAVYEQVKPETLSIPERTEHIAQMAENYMVPGYVGKDEICRLYDFNRAYPSEVSGRQAQYRQEETWWADHKLLSRAEKFAAGAVAENLAAEKKRLFAALTDRVKKAQQADAEKTKELENVYDTAIQEADRKAEKCHNDGLARREADYQSWLESAKSACRSQELLDIAKHFDGLTGYKDSKALAEHCRKRAEEEQAKIDKKAAEEAQKRKKRQEESDRKQKKRIVLAGCVAAVLLVGVVIFNRVILPKQNYSKAMQLIQAGDYEAGYTLLEQLGKSKEIKEDKYQRAEKLLEEGSYEEAYALLDEIGQETEVADNMYRRALNLLDEEEFEEADSILSGIEMDDELREKMYQRAVQYQENSDSSSMTAAQKLFEKLADYRDAASQAKSCSKEAVYLTGVEAYKSGNYEDAMSLFSDIVDYKDALEYLKKYQYVPTKVYIVTGSGTHSAYTFEYDQDGKMTAAKYFSESTLNTDTPSAVYLFDAAGRVVERSPMATGSSHLRYTTNKDGTVLQEWEIQETWCNDDMYDSAGNKTAFFAKTDFFSTTVGTPGWNELTLEFDKYGNYYKNCKNGYDAYGNLVSVAYKVNKLYINSTISYDVYPPCGEEASGVNFDKDLIWKNLRIICWDSMY